MDMFIFFDRFKISLFPKPLYTFLNLQINLLPLHEITNCFRIFTHTMLATRNTSIKIRQSIPRFLSQPIDRFRGFCSYVFCLSSKNISGVPFFFPVLCPRTPDASRKLSKSCTAFSHSFIPFVGHHVRCINPLFNSLIILS